MPASHSRVSWRLPAPLREVIVFRALKVGDMLCAVPALQALRAALPATHIVLVGLPWAAQFAHCYSALLDEFIAFPGHPLLPEAAADPQGWPSFVSHMRARRADLAIQLHGSGEVSNDLVREFGAHETVGYSLYCAADGDGFFPYPEQGHESVRLLGLMRALGLPAPDRRLAFPLRLSDDDELAASGVPAQLQGHPYACLHPGASDPARCWPVAAYAAAADGLAEAFGWRIVLTGTPGEHGRAQQVAQAMRHEAINAALPLSMGAMAALMDGARLLICNDSGACHMAAALALPSVVVFRQQISERWAPPDMRRHRRVRDPDGSRADQVLIAARQLMAVPAFAARRPSARD